MTFVSKSAGILSTASCVYDMHKNAVIEARKRKEKFGVNSFLHGEINSMKTDSLSFKDSQIKNWSAKHKWAVPIVEAVGMVSGYLNGFFSTGIKYIPNFIASGVAILSKNKRIANIGAVVLGVLEGWNFAKNYFGVKERKNYLDL